MSKGSWYVKSIFEFSPNLYFFTINRKSRINGSIWKINLKPTDVDHFVKETSFWKSLVTVWCKYNYRDLQDDDLILAIVELSYPHLRKTDIKQVIERQRRKKYKRSVFCFCKNNCVYSCKLLHVFISVIVFKFKAIKYLINEQSNCFLEHQGFQNKFWCNINWLDYKAICEQSQKNGKSKQKLDVCSW